MTRAAAAPALVVFETHPVQYHAPVYRALEQEQGVRTVAVYGSDHGVAGYLDREFGETVAWDTDLLGGYTPRFLPRAGEDARPALRRLVADCRSAIREARADAVLVPGYAEPLYWAAFLAAAAERRPVLFRAETTDHAETRGPLKRRVRDAALRRLYARSARLLYIGERSRRHYLRLGCGPERLVFAPYCVDTAAFRLGDAAREELRARTRAALGIAPDARVVLFSGKLVARKAPALLLRAARLLPPPVRTGTVLVFLGDGELRPGLEREAAEEPRVETRFVGFRNQSELTGFYHAADLLVLPSERGETWGLVVNEALHHGLPCVVSDAVGCAPDLVEPGVTGAVFRSGDAADLARRLAEVGPLVGDAATRAVCERRVAAYTVGRAARGIAEAVRAVVAPREVVHA